MQEREAIIGIYNEQGELIKTKHRSQVDKKQDILKTAIVLVFNNQNQIFTIRARESVWQKENWGGSCATLIRHQEDPKNAAKRTHKRELNIEAQPQFITEKYYNWKGIKRFLSVFKLETKKEIKPNPNDFYETRWISINEAEILVNNNQCIPTFEAGLKLLKNNIY